MKKLCLIIILLLPLLLKAQPVKVACVGNSVTFGYGLENPEKESYPVQLQQLLGENYLVKNVIVKRAVEVKNAQQKKNAVLLVIVIHAVVVRMAKQTISQSSSRASQKAKRKKVKRRNNM